MKKLLLLLLIASTTLIAKEATTPLNQPIEPIETLRGGIEKDSDIHPTIAIIGGWMQMDEKWDSVAIAKLGEGETKIYQPWEGLIGLEFGFDCLISDRLKQQIQLTYVHQRGLTIVQASLNPQFMFDIFANVRLGVGPSFGIAQVKKDIFNQEKWDGSVREFPIESYDHSVFTYGVGISLLTDITDDIFMGMEGKYELATDKTAFTHNSKIFVKFGYQF